MVVGEVNVIINETITSDIKQMIFSSVIAHVVVGNFSPRYLKKGDSQST